MHPSLSIILLLSALYGGRPADVPHVRNTAPTHVALLERPPTRPRPLAIHRRSQRDTLIDLPAGSSFLVFDENSLSAHDERGRRLGSKPLEAQRAFTTTQHAAVDFKRHRLLVDGGGSRLYLSVPLQTVRVRILAADDGMNGLIEAIDASGRVVAFEAHTDFHFTPTEEDPLAHATQQRLLLSVSADGRTATVRVPAGTRCLHFNAARLGNDGSIMALDATHRALAWQPNWNAVPEVRVGADSASRACLHASTPGTAWLHLPTGTRYVRAQHDTVTFYDEDGQAIGGQKHLRLVLHSLDPQ
jgi:hypothetical protein